MKKKFWIKDLLDFKYLHMKQTLLSQTNLSVRSINCLNTADIRTVEDLKKFASENPLNDLIKFRNFGRKSFKEVSEFLTSIELDKIESTLDSKIKYVDWDGLKENANKIINSDGFIELNYLVELIKNSYSE